MQSSPLQVTRLLNEWRNGNPAALEQLMPLVYAELHKLARRHMQRQNPSHALQTTALIHEAYLRLAGDSRKQWENRAQLYGGCQGHAACARRSCPGASSREKGGRMVGRPTR